MTWNQHTGLTHPADRDPANVKRRDWAARMWRAQEAGTLPLCSNGCERPSDSAPIFSDIDCPAKRCLSCCIGQCNGGHDAAEPRSSTVELVQLRAAVVALRRLTGNRVAYRDCSAGFVLDKVDNILDAYSAGLTS